MRKPWSSPLIAGVEYRESQPSSSQAEREKMDWAAGGLAVGIVAGLVAGSKLTFHSPVRKRLR
jgi:hypothetical protein